MAGYNPMFDFAGLDICFLAGTLGQGGAERQLFYILKTLRGLGAEPRVLCLTQGEFWEERFGEIGVPVTWVGRRRSRLDRLLDIIAELRRARPDVIQSQHFYTNLYAVAAARALGLREVGAIRSNAFSEVAADPLLGRLSLRAPRHLAANSRAGIENAQALGVPPRRLHLLPNVVDCDQFQPPESVAGGGAVQLLAVGRMSREKRFDRFLSIIADLRRRAAAPVKGLIVGDGPLRRQLEQQARALDLSPDVVEFRGYWAEMNAVYQTSDVLVMTSEFEGTPNVALEAMAAGLPVVATRVGGLPEVVKDGQTGFLIEAGKSAEVEAALTETMTEALLPLVNNTELRMKLGQSARRHIVANYSLQRLPNYLADLYRSAML